MERNSSTSGETVIVHSNAQLHLYPDNKPSRFTNKLYVPLKLTPEWEVALLDVQYRHKWFNFVKKTKVAVFCRGDRKKIADANLYQILRASNVETSLSKLTQTAWEYNIAPPDITDEMLRGKGLTQIRKGFLLLAHERRYRRFDFWPDFPDIPRYQRFEQTISDDEEYSLFELRSTLSWGEVHNFSRQGMIDFLQRAASNIEQRKSIYRCLNRRMTDGTTKKYLQLIPGPNNFEEKEANDAILNEAEETTDYELAYDDSLKIDVPSQPLVPRSNEAEENDADETPWFQQFAFKFQNYLNQTEVKRFVMAKQFTIPKAYFSTLTQFLDYITNNIRKAAGIDSHSFKYVYDNITETVTFSVSDLIAPLRICVDSDYLTLILGIQYLVKISSPNNSAECCYVYEFPCKSVRAPQLDHVQSISVYADVGELVQTGGILTPHLARLPISENPGSTVSFSPTYPLYVPVSKTLIDTIYIQINDSYGAPPPFSTHHLNSVSVTLHFSNPKSSNG